MPPWEKARFGDVVGSMLGSKAVYDPKMPAG
jgi:hypothetical protein